MAIIAFPTNPLRPYVGHWLIDPLSVGRRKKSISPLNDPGFAALYKCASIAERHAILAADPALAARYTALAKTRQGISLTVSATHLAFQPPTTPGDEDPPFPIMKLTEEGRTVVAEIIRRQQRVGYLFRLQKSWLLVSERYHGQAASLFPRSPVFRYYRASEQ